ncbi:response regulator [Methylomonas rapida]|uniref:Response regulator n=1 Tax=Methylomonas rapida TaxID=2963939 RepID=A0ABY7GK09_9GAMM|nr:response regulator [Methylomonas rapida]WAR43213.1 response regulator [Methylomonas rapida]
MSKTDPVIIIVEDELAIRQFLRTALRLQGYTVFEAETGQRGLVEANIRKPDLLILDLGLPDMDGIEVIKAIRAWSTLPIIVLSARSQERQKVDALDLGADDYLTKPFGVEELIARIRVALRHANRKEQSLDNDVLVTGGLKVDLSKRLVSVDGREIALTPIQYRLLAVLAKNAGKVMTHRQIMKEVWGPSYVDNVHYVRMYMSQLRHKLETDPAKPQYLVTESGLGYRLKIKDE